MPTLSKILASVPHIPSGMPCLRSFTTYTTCTSNTPSIIPPTTSRRWENRGRGGQNLTERYRMLENRFRGKNTFIEQISGLSQNIDDPSKSRPSSRSDVQRVPDTIAGFTIPEEPIPPADEGKPYTRAHVPLACLTHVQECCMSGCAICVYDLYQESLEAYKESLAALRSSLSALSIAESEWPERIRTTARIPAVDQRQDATLSAFEEMERQLKEKRERRAAVEAES